MLVEGDQDVHLLNVNLSFLLVHLEGLSLGHFLDHAHLALRYPAELDSDSSASDQLDFPLFNFFNVLEGDFFGKRLVPFSFDS